MEEFALSLAQGFTDPLFLILGVIASFLVKRWKCFWVFPVLGLGLSGVFFQSPEYEPPLASVIASVTGMSLLGLMAALGREYLGNGFGRSAT